MITEKQLKDLGLETYDLGYYQITETTTIDAEGDIRIETNDIKPIWVASVYDIEDLKVFIKCMNR